MARPIYPYEMGDADFTWLITHYTENNTDCLMVEDSCLPVVFIKAEAKTEEFIPDSVPVHELADGEISDGFPTEDTAE